MASLHTRSTVVAAMAGLALSVCMPARGTADNPLIPTVYSADPSAHVWPGDDRLWIYSSHDQPETNTHATMISYHVFSSSDLVNWTDYGVVLHLKNVEWAASHMWAIDAVRWKGLYYLAYCAQEKGTGIFRTGLATSKLPQGPFTDIGFVQGVDWGQDPALFVDDDGQPYLFWGAGGGASGAKLTEDLRSIVPGSKVDFKEQLTYVFEGPWVHKHQGKYYLSYPGLPDGQWPEHMYYAVADAPLGPYRFVGKYIAGFPQQSGTNHGSIIEYRGKWYSFYHSAWLSGGISETRNLMADELRYGADGTILPITPTRAGVAAGGARPGPSRVVVQLDAENGEAALGSLLGTAVGSERPGFTGSGYVFGFDQKNDAVTVFVQSAKARQARLKIRYAAPAGDQYGNVLVNYTMLHDPASPDAKGHSKQIFFPKATEWAERDCGLVSLREGDNTIHLSRGTGDIEVDHFRLEPVPEPDTKP